MIRAFERDLEAILNKHSLEGIILCLEDPDSADNVIILGGSNEWLAQAVEQVDGCRKKLADASKD